MVWSSSIGDRRQDACWLGCVLRAAGESRDAAHGEATSTATCMQQHRAAEISAYTHLQGSKLHAQMLIHTSPFPPGGGSGSSCRKHSHSDRTQVHAQAHCWPPTRGLQLHARGAKQEERGGGEVELGGLRGVANRTCVCFPIACWRPRQTGKARQGGSLNIWRHFSLAGTAQQARPGAAHISQPRRALDRFMTCAATLCHSPIHSLLSIPRRAVLPTP